MTFRTLNPREQMPTRNERCGDTEARGWPVRCLLSPLNSGRIIMKVPYFSHCCLQQAVPKPCHPGTSQAELIQPPVTLCNILEMEPLNPMQTGCLPCKRVQHQPPPWASSHLSSRNGSQGGGMGEGRGDPSHDWPVTCGSGELSLTLLWLHLVT